MMQVRQWSAVWGAMLGVMAAGPAGAQGYPTKPVQLQVPFAPGGTTDIVARAISDPLGKALGQPVIVINKAGGGGIVGANETAKAPPDGYQLGVATVSTTAANPAINPKIPYNPLTDFTPIINVAATPNVIAVHPGFPAKDYKAFIAELKKSPGKHSYASSGTGGIGHLQMELYKNLSGTFVTHIPYRGAGPALTDTVAGNVPMIFDNLPSALPFIRDKRLIAIVVAAPVGLPADVKGRLHAALVAALNDPQVKPKLLELGFEIVGNTPEQFAAFQAAEFARWKKVIEVGKITAD